eukprot:TRINITY_DN884_c0_g3_i4.p1 TRINITY_DN884_c0_g3~~TRINITY_DN884_c0_g3_i4.p1  ORF type:complete len:753 (-),score=336.81 TRINITY_DN884_c0_g3_i4:58-2316(-)
MKSPMALLFAAVGLRGAWSAQVKGDRAVTKVVKLLEGMLEKSKEDGDKDREIYAKFKCYCDTQEAKKTQEIDDLSAEIASLESKIEELLGSTGALSTECAELRTAMMDNEQARATATKLREKEHENFVAEETDLTAALDQMTLAISTLSEVGADQTLGSAADHKMFMAKKDSLLSLKANVKQALVAASAFLEPKQQAKVTSFLQGPGGFTGTYSAVSGEVVGILKDMKDTFTSNLETARATEKAQLKAYDAFMELKTTEYEKMSDLYNEKQAALGTNDDDLASRRELLAEDKEQKAIKEEFLEQLEPLCEERKKEYEQRTALRANEDAAISEALAILNSDQAFSTFGKVSASSTGGTGPASFLQLVSVKPHSQQDDTRAKVLQMLRQAASSQGSLRLAQLASSLGAENPFSVVLKEITKMVATIEEEGKVDKEKLDWCRKERETKNGEVDEKDNQITELGTTIDELTKTIEEPETGLKDSIARDEASLIENGDSQKTATETRQEENAAYQTDISHLVEAEDLLARAVKVLDAYYSDIPDFHEEEKRETATLSGEESAVPTTFEDEQGFKGQSSNGNKAIEMIQFILDETKKEETVAHTDEQASQKDYESLMTGLKEEETRLKDSLANLRATLAQKEKELADAKKLLEETEAEKKAILAYLESIKAGCDFMEENFEHRESRRASETEALLKAEGLLKETPAYKAAVAAQDLEDLGDCKTECTENSKEHVKCKACLAKVEIPGYCAGHPGTEGC